MHRVNLYSRLFFLLSGLGFQVFAQIGTSTITGAVTDPTGAAVSGVKVLVVETSKNFESRSETEHGWAFSRPVLAAGNVRRVL